MSPGPVCEAVEWSNLRDAEAVNGPVGGGHGQSDQLSHGHFQQTATGRLGLGGKQSLSKNSTTEIPTSLHHVDLEFCSKKTKIFSTQVSCFLIWYLRYPRCILTVDTSNSFVSFFVISKFVFSSHNRCCLESELTL